ncbi:IS200/IS605 family transposase [Mycobacteroides abscessus]|nr:transposase IS200-family protein [Mycobacteroides abscessus subsp. abscessus]SIF91512.1 transposase IS200-family protein [Mycobacteroides abscessus subsp. abscessus]SKO09237.1 transposase IS200-family protein [Mycobacteroides abscessus subsp. abscessus]SLC18076.1 transposase IS200-family protein [Mycobacteroides abscessus subsp. abscessus]
MGQDEFNLDKERDLDDAHCAHRHIEQPSFDCLCGGRIGLNFHGSADAIPNGPDGKDADNWQNQSSNRGNDRRDDFYGKDWPAVLMPCRRKPNPDLRTVRSVVYNLQVYLVFMAKHRRSIFTHELLARCEQIMGATCRSYGAELREFHGAADYVWLVVDYPPRIAISRLADNLKTVSARRLRQEFPDHNLWSPSYFAASYGAPIAIMKGYIEHHQR